MMPTMAVVARGKVQMLDCSGEMPVLRWIKRNDGVLLEEAEWDWTDDRKAAFIFESYELAERAAVKLQEDERAAAMADGRCPTKISCGAVVYGSDAMREDRAQAEPPRSVGHVADRSEECVEKLERMHLW